MGVRSRVFRSMLFGERWKEQVSTGTIRMEQNTPLAFRAMLHYIHAGSVVFDPATVMELLQLSDYFALDALKSGCGEFIAKSISAETAPVLLQTAHTFGEENLVTHCLAFIEENTDAVLDTDGFPIAALSEEMLCLVVQV